MINNIFKLKMRVILIVFTYISLVSCNASKDVVYFQNVDDVESTVNTDTFEPKFKIDDIVSIFVSTFDMQAASPFNLSTGGITGGENSETGGSAIDYLIGKDGNINFPVLGKVHLLGLTNEEAKQLLVEKLKDYLKSPIVNIRIKNFRVTVLGAVNNPGTYNVASERLTILEAIGLAGDLNIKGRRDNILVIRDFNGTKTYTRANITTKEITNSPVFYLTQNDVIYVEPNKSGASASKENQLPIILSVVTSVLTIATGVIVLTNNN